MFRALNLLAVLKIALFFYPYARNLISGYILGNFQGNSQIAGAMGQRGFPYVEELSSGLLPVDMGYKFFNDNLPSVIYGGESYISLLETDSLTGEPLSQTYGHLSERTIEVSLSPSTVPLPASLPLLLLAAVGLGMMSRLKRLMSRFETGYLH